MIIDAQVVLGTSRYGMALHEDVALERGAREDVALSVACPPHPLDQDLARANEELAASVQRAQGRLAGLCRVDPWDGDLGLELFRQAIGSLGLRGVFLNPFEEHFRINDARLQPFAQLAAELRVPVVIATGYPWASEPTQVAEFARWCPDVPVVMTNGGQFNISGLSQVDAEATLGLDNVHLYTSGVYREDFLQKVVESFGADRLLFASSAPYFDLRYEKRRVELLHIGEEDRQKVLASNAQRVFSLHDPVVTA